MLALKIFCWVYLIFIILGRIVNYDKCSPQANAVRFLDYLMTTALIIFLYLIYK